MFIPNQGKPKAWLKVSRPTYLYKFKFNIAGIGVTISQRRRDKTMGRFSGDCSYKLGITIGRSTYRIHYGVGEITIVNYRYLTRKYPDAYTHKGEIRA